MDTVIQRYYQNQISDDDLLEALEDATEEWHKGGSEVSLCEYLGMCEPEYNIWIIKPSRFMRLIQAQKNFTPLGVGDD